MPVVINEIEVVEQSQGPSTSGAPAPAPARPAALHEAFRLLQSDLQGRQQRRIAD